MATITLNIAEDFVAEYNGKKVTAVDLANSSDAVAYLLAYGWSQSLQDSVSGTKKKVLDGAVEDVKKMAGAVGLDTNVDFASIDRKALAESILSSTMDERAAAILNGTIGHRVGGQRLDPIDRAIRDIVESIIAKRARDKKLPVPKGEDMAALRDEYLANVANATRVRSMAEARVAEEAMLAQDAAE